MTNSRPVAEGQDRVLELEQQIANLKLAVDSRQRIGVSIGLLAAQLDCKPDQAWEFLAWLSQNTNTKARIVAQVLIDLHCGTLAPSDQELAHALQRLLPPGDRPVVVPRRPTDDDQVETPQVTMGTLHPLRPATAIPRGLPQSMVAGL